MTWKPGDVALVDSWRGERQIAFRVYRSGVGADWCVLDGTDTRGLEDSEIRSAYPVVVIDPESAEDVIRLRKVLHDSGAFTGLAKGNKEKIAAALREFAAPTPPKPAEPQGLGAVVEDADGTRYVRTEHGDTTRIAWYCPGQEDLDGHWDDVPAVRVLSEGVTP